MKLVCNIYVEVDDRQGIQMSVLGKVDPAENPYHGDAILSHRNGVVEEVWGAGIISWNLSLDNNTYKGFVAITPKQLRPMYMRDCFIELEQIVIKEYERTTKVL